MTHARFAGLPGTVLRWFAVLAACIAPLTAFSAPVIEFYNSGLDNYFITGNAIEAAAVDSGAAGPGWTRTGDTFNEGGLSPVCRFYGSISPGPNSHFYTVDPAECTLLKQLQAVTPPTQTRWNFESLDFITTAPANGVCPAGTVPVYRAYNNGNARGIDSNHRITTSQAGIAQVVARGWVSEGVVLCGATPATVAATAQFWQQANGMWVFGSGSQPTVFRFTGAGGYLTGTTQGTGQSTEHPGLERGTINYDPLSKRMSAIIAQDTNGNGGFSGRGPAEELETFAVESGAIVARDPAGTELYRLKRLANDQSGIVGAWVLGSDSDLGAQHFIFSPDGHYMMIDPVGDADSPFHQSCGGPGVELGTYTWEGGTGTLAITGITIDTNGCAGLNTPPDSTTIFGGARSLSGLTLSDGGNTMSLFTFVFRRVSQ